MVDTSHPAVERIESTVKIVLVQIIENHDKSNETNISKAKTKKKETKERH